MRSLLVVLLSLPSALALADGFAFTHVPPLAQDRGSFGAFGYPGGGGFQGYAYGDGYAPYSAQGGAPYGSYNAGGFQVALPLGAFAAADHPGNLYLEMEHAQRVARQINETSARISQQYIEGVRIRADAEAKATIIRASLQGAAYVAAAAAQGSQAPPSPVASPQVQRLPAVKPQVAPTLQLQPPMQPTRTDPSSEAEPAAIDQSSNAPQLSWFADAVARGQSLMTSRCTDCHGAEKHEGGLDLSDLSRVTDEQWDHDEDGILNKIRRDDMPPVHKLTIAELGDVFAVRQHMKSQKEVPPTEDGQ